MGEPTLLPCPFCGGEATLGPSPYGVPIRCGTVDCSASVSSYFLLSEAAERWNTRAPNPLAATLAARDELVRELGEELREREAVCDMWRSSVSEGIEERDRLRARIATLECELAEARPKAEAAERWARANEACEHYIPSEGGPRWADVEQARIDACIAILDACPEKGGVG